MQIVSSNKTKNLRKFYVGNDFCTVYKKKERESKLTLTAIKDTLTVIKAYADGYQKLTLTVIKDTRTVIKAYSDGYQNLTLTVIKDTRTVIKAYADGYQSLR